MQICGWRARNCPGDAAHHRTSTASQATLQTSDWAVRTIRPYLDLCCQRSTIRKGRHHLARKQA